MSLETVRSYPTPEPTPQITIDFSPHSEAFTYNVGETAYAPANAFYGRINQPLTFTATTVFPVATRTPVAYEWEFGDGRKGYGNPVTHTYSFSNTVVVHLTVTDNHGKEWRVSKTMYLRKPLGLAGVAVTDTLKHPSLPASFTVLPWSENSGTWSEGSGWEAGSFAEAYYEVKGNSRSGVYWTTEKIKGGSGCTILQTNGTTSSEKRSFGVWLFSAAGAEPSGYQAIAINEAVAPLYRIVLRKWVGGVVTKLDEVTGIPLEAGGAIAVQAKLGKVSAWQRQTEATTWTIAGTENSDTTFTEGYSGFGGNGSNPFFTNFATGVI